MPSAMNDKRTIEKTGEFVVPSNKRAIPPTTAGMAAWYRRSSFRSELRETRTITSRPTRCGIMTRSPTMELEYRLERDLTSWGIQKLIEYKPIAMVNPIEARCQTRPSDRVRVAEI